jgi:hypothetical protein
VRRYREVRRRREKDKYSNSFYPATAQGGDGEGGIVSHRGR